MSTILIHLSDIHFRLDWEESQEKVLDAFWSDLQKQIVNYKTDNIYLVISGDLVQAGGNSELYENFFTLFDTKLNELGIRKENRICVPGNHDISVEYVKSKCVEHDGIIKLGMDEKTFNDYITAQPALLLDKFDNYMNFQSDFAKYGLSDNNKTGSGYILNDDIAIYCLNTALCSSGGYNDIDDEKKLCISTRNLQKWLSKHSDVKYKILIMHHHIDSLCDWSQKALKIYLEKDFNLCLSGHIHDQSLYHDTTKNSQLTYSSAPPLFTCKNDELGYTFIEIESRNTSALIYRQWTKRNNFVSGVNFTDNDSGIVRLQNRQATFIDSTNDFVSEYFELKLDQALRTYSSQPIVWIDRIISSEDDASLEVNEDSDKKVDIVEFIKAPKSTIIKAPPQFGLTCLALKMVLDAWKLTHKTWIYLDIYNITPNNLKSKIQEELKLRKNISNDISCFIIDSLLDFDKNNNRIIKRIENEYPDIPIIIMHTMGESQYMTRHENGNEEPIEDLETDFDTLFLLSLPRKSIRKVVSKYNENKNIGEDNVVIEKVVSDLSVLNIHRTPLNCITILTVSEKFFDESPVNRTVLLEKLLYLLFDSEEIPRYKSKPDVKDCEYIMGVFCENMIRTNNYKFYRDSFLSSLKSECSKKLIDLDIDLLFDILYANNIITNYGNEYYFRYSYWLYYFAARRMHHDSAFVSYILENKRYINYPEIVEFYTGIDRNRDNAIEILIRDMKDSNERVENKIGISDNINPLKLLNWNPTLDSMNKVHAEISEPVQNSKLPDDIKDHFADQNYNPSKPYNQSIQNILEEYSVVILMQDIKAASRALRNSDYVKPELKKELFKEITQAWNQLAKVLFALTPILAMQGHAGFDGAGFILVGNKDTYGDSLENRIMHVLTLIPYNIMRWFREDLYSPKIGPLLHSQLLEETNDILKHQIALLIIFERPSKWKDMILSYISAVPKNSFYLYDIFSALRIQYKYSFSSSKELKDMAFLIKAGIAKHELGTKSPGISTVSKIPNSVLPDREVDEDENSDF